MPGTLIVHGHFYQPPRENPWTEEVSVERSAAPAHDWNERITAECYRPNGWARVVDERGRVAAIVDNYEHLSFNMGPTLLSWLAGHHPAVYDRILEADARGGGAIAQAYNHMILPLATERDVRTQVRWGLADFEARFGRMAAGMWLPETAVNDAVLAVLAEEGVAFTILAPSQAEDEIDAREPYRWTHPDGVRGVDILFYDGALSHDLAFSLSGLTSEELVRRVAAAAGDEGIVVVATDGETFGHHHKFADRTLAFAFDSAAAAAGVSVANAAEVLRDRRPVDEVRIRESSWSCVHGVGRWREDCGCHTGGQPGWNQRWRAPLREALDQLRDFGVEVFSRRGSLVLRDPWAARDEYLPVVLGTRTVDDFVAEHVKDPGDAVEALTLLEAQRHALLMYTSCGWFFNDLAGIETVQVLRYAARVMDLLAELGEAPPTAEFLDVLARAESNEPDEGDGRAIWSRHIEPSRVDAERVVAHVALVDLLERRDLPPVVGGYELVEHEHRHRERANLAGSAGRVVLVHRRTRRRTEHVYAAVHLGGLEVFGATREARPDVDDDLFTALNDAVAGGERVPTILRIIGEGFGPREFGLESALPDAADQIVASAAAGLVDRFAQVYEHLYSDHRSRLAALLTAGYALPPSCGRRPSSRSPAGSRTRSRRSATRPTSPRSARPAPSCAKRGRERSSWRRPARPRRCRARCWRPWSGRWPNPTRSGWRRRSACSASPSTSASGWTSTAPRRSSTTRWSRGRPSRGSPCWRTRSGWPSTPSRRGTRACSRPSPPARGGTRCRRRRSARGARRRRRG